MNPRSSTFVVLALVGPSAVFADPQPLYNELPDERVLYVAPGQSLGGLVRKAYPNQTDHWTEIRQWIVENNPHGRILPG